MSETAPETLSVVVERDVPSPPEKIWRALTEPHLIEEWLLKSNFEPVVGRHFSLQREPQPNWNGVIDCQVLVVETNKVLSYRWTALGVETVVTFTLTPTSSGTHLRVEQSGFRRDRPQNYRGANYGWQKFFANLERLLTRVD